MKRVLMTLTLLLIFSAPTHGAQTTAVLGSPAPDFTLSDTNDHARSLHEFRGKIVVLEWTNHECPYVKKHYESGNMQALQKEAFQQGAVWLTIASSARGEQGFIDIDQARAVIEKTGGAATARLLDFDGQVGRLYGAKTTPHMFIIDRNGILTYEGAIDDAPSTNPETLINAKNYVRAALADLQAGRPVKTQQTRPYGCSVKYAR